MLFNHMVELESHNLSELLKATSDPTRRVILSLLAQHGPLRVTQIATHFDMSLNSVSKHIKMLERAGLVLRRTEWREHLIEIQMDRLKLVDRWFEELRSIWDLRLEALDDLITMETANDTDNN